MNEWMNELCTLYFLKSVLSRDIFSSTRRKGWSRSPTFHRPSVALLQCLRTATGWSTSGRTTACRDGRRRSWRTERNANGRCRCRRRSRVGFWTRRGFALLFEVSFSSWRRPADLCSRSGTCRRRVEPCPLFSSPVIWIFEVKNLLCKVE